MSASICSCGTPSRSPAGPCCRQWSASPGCAAGVHARRGDSTGAGGLDCLLSPADIWLPRRVAVDGGGPCSVVPSGGIMNPRPDGRSARVKRLRVFAGGLLHPWRHVTGALGGGVVAGFVKRTGSRCLFEYMARRYPQTEWSTMNYGYAGSPEEPSPEQISTSDPERFDPHLYSRGGTSG